MTLREVANLHGLDLSVFPKHVSINYNQLRAKDSDPVASNCRGVVLCERWGRPIDPDSIQEYELVARPPKRFHNLSQGSAAFKTIEAGDQGQVKYDGSCIITYFDHVVTGRWQCGTRSNPLAGQQINGGFGMTYRELFEKGAGCSLDEYCADFDKRFTYFDELVGPYNHLVVVYDKVAVNPISRVCRETGKEYSRYNGPVIQVADFEEAKKYVTSLPPNISEGLVVTRVNPQTSEVLGRVKIKSKAYTIASRQGGSDISSERGIMEVILDSAWDDAREVVPEHIRVRGDDLQKNLQTFAKNRENLFQAIILLTFLEDNTKMKDWEACIAAWRKRVAKSGMALCPKEVPMLMSSFDLCCIKKSFSVLEYLQTQKKDGKWPKRVLDNVIESCDRVNRASQKEAEEK